MRIKIVPLLAAAAALVVGVVTSQASFHSQASVNVKLAKAGAPGTVTIVIDNKDSANVPQRVDSVVITSKVAKWNPNGAPQCSVAVPTNAAGTNTGGALNPPCPPGSKVGTGTFSINTGVVGQPIPFNDLGVITGVMNLYNYKPAGGQQAAMLIEFVSDLPIPDTHQYTLAVIDKAGVITTNIPNIADLAPKIADYFHVNPPTDMSFRTLSMAGAVINIKPPKPKKGKAPFFTLKNTKNIDYSLELNRG